MYTALFVVVAIFYIFLVMYTRRLETGMLVGIWSACPDFCEESELDMFTVKIGAQRPEDPSNCYPGYLLAKNQDELIINSPVNFIITGGWAFGLGLRERNYDVKIEWVLDGGCDYFPSSQTLRFYPAAGRLVFIEPASEDGPETDQINLIAYRDACASSIHLGAADDGGEEEDDDEDDEDEFDGFDFSDGDGDGTPLAPLNDAEAAFDEFEGAGFDPDDQTGN